MNGQMVLCKGLSVSKGLVHGKIKKVSGRFGQDVCKGDILVLHSSDPTFVLCVMQAGGVIMERGGRLAHLCVIALEMGIPCITAVENAMEILADGQQVMMDAGEGTVYAVEC